MPSEYERAVLQDILHHLDLIQQFTQQQEYEDFRLDTLRIYAVTRCLEIISEASRQLSDELKALIPGEAAHRSGIMPPTHSEMISPAVPR